MEGVSRMMRLSGVVRWSAFALMVLFGLFGSLFVVGEAMTDPGGRQGLALSALWVVPMVAACLLATLRPHRASAVFHGALLVIVALWLWYVLDQQWWTALMDERGPILAIAGFALGVPVAVLGLTHPRTAGQLLVMLAFTPVVARLVAESMAAGESGIGPEAVLGTSAGVSALPQLVVGLLFLLSWLVRPTALAEPTAPPDLPPPPPADAAASRTRHDESPPTAAAGPRR